jgi:acyl homoserine lactone synthase
MHVITLNKDQFGRHLDLLAAVYRLRRRVFKDRLDWSVSISGDLELDVYDTLNPTYLVGLNDNVVVSSVRLLPTTGPTMLGNTFPELLGGKTIPSSSKVIESSRFCVDTRLAAQLGGHGLNRATLILFAAMIESLQNADADSIVTVTDVRMERILRRANWPLERIAPPRRIGETMALAGFLHASNETLAGMYQKAAVAGPVLQGIPALNRAA